MATIKKHVKTIIQLRRATESEWVEANPILRVGEPALSTDVYKLKIGDGTRHWSEIDYLGLDASELIELLKDYGALTNKPKIEGVILQGNKTFEDLSLNSLSNLEIEQMLSM